MFLSVFLFFLVSLHLVISADFSEWQSRVIYQILTDRFERPTDFHGVGLNLSDYLGGTWSGIEMRLDYVTGMGFDAIWISPIVKNTPMGYHGYWAENFLQVNDHFGDSASLKSLSASLHERQMFLMVDVVANHVGSNAPLSSIHPFNRPEDYHDCELAGCPPSNCWIDNFQCLSSQIQQCQLDGLPDLNQTQPYVRSQLLSWIDEWVVKQFSVDGLRIDTVEEVQRDFWIDFVSSADCWAVGEVDTPQLSCLASFESAVGGLLSYPMYWTLRSVFAQEQSMYQLRVQFNAYSKLLQHPERVGLFIENHDHERFLFYGTMSAYRNALCYVLFARGIPIIYYGTAQAFNGGAPPLSREPLWPSGFSTSTPLYQFLREAISVRQQRSAWKFDHIERYCDEQLYVFSRGTVLVALTNQGSSLSQRVPYLPYQNGERVCRVALSSLDAEDCQVVQNGTGILVNLVNGEPSIYVSI